MKVCTKCNLEKQESEFYKIKNRLESWCKACMLIRRRKVNHMPSPASINIEKAINKTARKKEEFARIKVGNVIKGLKVIFKNSSFMVLIDPRAPYRKITYTVNDFIVNTK